MNKKEKKRGKQTEKSEGDNLLKKLSRAELLELLLEQTRRADDLEKQLSRALQERDDNDSKLRDVLTLYKFAIEMIDKEAGQRAHDIIERQIAEGKLIRTEDIKSKLAEYENEIKTVADTPVRTTVRREVVKPVAAQESVRREVPKTAAKPASALVHRETPKPVAKPVSAPVHREPPKPAVKPAPVKPHKEAPAADSVAAYIDENGFIDVAKIFGVK